MVATYTQKPGRRYRYYVCQGARRNGWKSCPTKSVPADLIERSVMARLNEGTTQEQNPAEVVRSRIKQVVYDGTSGAVSVVLEEA